MDEKVDEKVEEGRTHELTREMGRRLRLARTERGWTQTVLGTRAEVSVRMLADIEQGRANPSIAILIRLTEALGLPLAALVLDTDRTQPLLADHDDSRVLWTDSMGSTGTLIIAGHGPDQLELWEWRLEPGSEHRAEAHPSGTIEILRVNSGVLHLTTGGKPYEVTAGTAISFAADNDHTYANPGDEPVTFTHVHFQPRR